MAKQISKENDEEMFVTLDIGKGRQEECKILSIFDVKGQDYIALLPLDEKGREKDDGEVYIYRYFEDGKGNPSLDNILDDKEWDAVSEVFEEIYQYEDGIVE